MMRSRMPRNSSSARVARDLRGVLDISESLASVIVTRAAASADRRRQRDIQQRDVRDQPLQIVHVDGTCEDDQPGTPARAPKLTHVRHRCSRVSRSDRRDLVARRASSAESGNPIAGIVGGRSPLRAPGRLTSRAKLPSDISMYPDTSMSCHTATASPNRRTSSRSPSVSAAVASSFASGAMRLTPLACSAGELSRCASTRGGQPRANQLELRTRRLGILPGWQHPPEHEHTRRAAFDRQRHADNLQTVPGDGLRQRVSVGRSSLRRQRQVPAAPTTRTNSEPGPRRQRARGGVAGIVHELDIHFQPPAQSRSQSHDRARTATSKPEGSWATGRSGR